MEIRQEMASILDQLNSLPPEAISERSWLASRKDELRDMLRQFNAEDSDDVARRWSERAGSKPGDDSGKPFIPSHGEGGQAGG